MQICMQTVSNKGLLFLSHPIGALSVNTSYDAPEGEDLVGNVIGAPSDDGTVFHASAAAALEKYVRPAFFCP